MPILGRRRFTLSDQLQFAALSGDRNPMHIDPLAARRTQAGSPVVHGIHGALWALDLLARAGEPIGPDLQIRFESFLYLDVDVEAELRLQAGQRSVVLQSHGRRITAVSMKPARAKPAARWESLETAEAIPGAPLDLDFAQASAAHGCLALGGDVADFSQAFPSLAVAIGPERVRAIAGLSTLVGMRVPGLHSIFSKCQIALLPEAEGPPAFHFAVERAREPLRQLSIAYAGSGIAGIADVFVRSPPVAQANLEELEDTVVGLDLAGQRALVVGGSRGIGELTAKMAALAGAQVTVTYAQGADDAAKLCETLGARGLVCRSRQLDVRRLAEVPLETGEFTHLYYFATPPIFSRTKQHYDPEQFANFAAFYCDAFETLCRRIQGASALKAFWPSTTAIDERPKGLTEYVMAKLAGEALCDELNRSYPGLEITTLRLPRVETDQTISVTPVRSTRPIELIRGVLDALA